MKTFEEYLKEIHASTYMGTDDDMPDNFDQWFIPLDAEVVAKYAEEWNKEQIRLAEQSLVQRVNKLGDDDASPDMYKEGYNQAIDDILSISTPKPKGDE